jgi:hypothetical protein
MLAHVPLPTIVNKARYIDSAGSPITWTSYVIKAQARQCASTRAGCAAMRAFLVGYPGRRTTMSMCASAQTTRAAADMVELYPAGGGLYPVPRIRAGFREAPVVTKEQIMSLGTILLIVVILILIGVLPTWPHARSWGYGPSGIVGVVLLIVIVLFLMGRL